MLIVNSKKVYKVKKNRLNAHYNVCLLTSKKQRQAPQRRPEKKKERKKETQKLGSGLDSRGAAAAAAASRSPQVCMYTSVINECPIQTVIPNRVIHARLLQHVYNYPTQVGN